MGTQKVHLWHPSLLYVWLLDQIGIVWGFLRYDFTATVAPSLLFSIASWHTPAGQHKSVEEVLITSLCYSTLYALTITISGQAKGVEEDKIEKPDRPIPQGLITVQGAWLLWRVVVLAYLLLSAYLGVLHWTVLWFLTVVVHNLCGGSRNWIIKNLSMSLGTVSLLGAAWEQVSPLTVEVLVRWVFFLPAAMFLLYSLQDLRDVKGDIASGRRTFPHVYGLRFSRKFLGVGFVALSLAVYFGPMQQVTNLWLLIADVLSVIPALYVALRLFFPQVDLDQSDHTTYMWFTYWFCCCLAAAIIAL